MTKAYLIVNFGGPRHQGEILPFLQELLTDRDVIRTGWPRFLHNLFFSHIAKKRARRTVHDYDAIGGGSPIYADTEELARQLHTICKAPVLTFHRYLPATHANFIQEIENTDCREIIVFPMFPQFSYATTGSIARWFQRHLSDRTASKLHWVRSYPDHPQFVRATQEAIRSFLQSQNLDFADVFFLFSAHGLPRKFIDTGDPYEGECKRSHMAVMEAFPGIPSLLSYQSKFGRGEWLRPYTEEIAATILQHHQGRSVLVVVPISFTSDHIETLFEIEQLYLPVIRQQGIVALRCPALGLRHDWIQAIPLILEEQNLETNDRLIRKSFVRKIYQYSLRERRSED